MLSKCAVSWVLELGHVVAGVRGAGRWAANFVVLRLAGKLLGKLVYFVS